jgi:hypothetical protein
MAASPDPNLGDRLAALHGMVMDTGMTTVDAAKKLGVTKELVRDELGRLAQLGRVEVLAPDVWRLVARHRGTRELVKRAAGLVYRGEWTTYGDLSLVVRGDEEGSQRIALVASTEVGIPNPHRILQKGGKIAAKWSDSSGNGPTDCRHLLEVEGLVFDTKGAADSDQYVDAKELINRWDAEY